MKTIRMAWRTKLALPAIQFLCLVVISRAQAPDVGGGVPVGGLRWEGNVLVPCQLDWRPSSQTTRNNQSADQPIQQSHQVLQAQSRQGEILRQKAMASFNKSRWAESIDYLQQALQEMPGDKALLSSLASARVALRWQQIEQRAAEEAKRHAAEDHVKLTNALDRLSETLNSLQQETSQILIDKGQFEAALRLPAQTDFLVDSSVVDLRQARQGAVDFDVLKPPVSRTGDVEFLKPTPRFESPETQKARKLLDDPSLQAVIFSERMGEAIGYAPSAEEHNNRFADPVNKSVADYLGIKISSASLEQRAYVQQKTNEIWNAYDKRNAELSQLNQELNQRSIDSFKKVLAKLTSEGIIKPHEALLERERSDPVFRSLMQSETKRIILEEEVCRREGNRQSFDKLLADISTILNEKPPR